MPSSDYGVAFAASMQYNQHGGPMAIPRLLEEVLCAGMPNMQLVLCQVGSSVSAKT